MKVHLIVEGVTVYSVEVNNDVKLQIVEHDLIDTYEGDEDCKGKDAHITTTVTHEGVITDYFEYGSCAGTRSETWAELIGDIIT